MARLIRSDSSNQLSQRYVRRCRCRGGPSAAASAAASVAPRPSSPIRMPTSQRQPGGQIEERDPRHQYPHRQTQSQIEESQIRRQRQIPSELERMIVRTPSMSFPVFEQSLAPVKAPEAPTAPDAAEDLTARRLSAAVALGDESAFRELYDGYRARLFRFALVLGRGDETLAHDTVQNVFVTAAGKLRKVESADHLWNWLARVARQHLSKAWRQRQRESAAVAEAALPAHSAEADSLMEQHL